MASIYKRGSTWTANIFVIKDGQRRRKTKSGFKTKAQAKGWANEMEVAKQNNSLTLRSDMLLADFYDKWFVTFKEPTVTKATAKWYEYVGKSLRDYFPTTRIDSMDRVKFQSFLNAFGKTHGVNTARKMRTLIKQVSVAAIADGYISKDFTYHTKVTGQEPKSADMKFLEEDDMKALVDYIESKPLVNRAVTDMMILTALQSGARYAEIAGLEWRDIDFERGLIHIETTWDQFYKEFKPTKTASSVRDIDMSVNYMNELSEWHTLRPETTFVFEGDNRIPPTSNAANKQLRRDLDDISSTKVITFHGLRHTHASWLLAHDVDLHYVSERLGHANTTITLNTYSHLLKTRRNSEIDKSINLLSSL